MSATITLAPGLHRGVSTADYLAIDAMSASKLELLRRSPLQLRYALDNPTTHTSDALERGTALHLAILEPALFSTRYVVAEPCEQLLGKSSRRPGEPCGNPGLFLLRDGMGWACGTHLKGFGSRIDSSAEVITAENDAKVRGMAAAVAGHAVARAMFEGAGEFESVVIFRDPETDVLCRVRPDRLVKRAGMLVELKSTRDASVLAFPVDAERRGYFRKLALYRRALRAIGWPYTTAAVLAVESEAPHDLICYLADEGDLDAADREVSRLLARYAACVRDDFWPGYNPDLMTTLARPAWARSREEHDDG